MSEWLMKEHDGYFILTSPDGTQRSVAAGSWTVKEIMEFAATRLNALEAENATLKAKAVLADEAATTFKYSRGDAGWRKGWLARHAALGKDTP